MYSHHYEVSTSNLAVWRHAHFPRDFVSFQDVLSVEMAFEVVLRLLADPVVRSFLNELDGGPGGSRFDRLYERLALRRNATSHPRRITRQVDYCMQLLISSVMRNDTGKKGSIGLVPLRSLKRQLPETEDRLVIIPEPNCSDFEAALQLAEAFNTTLCVSQRQNLEKRLRSITSKRYEFRVSTKLRLRVGEALARKVLGVQEAVGGCLASQLHQVYGAQEAIIPYSVDYFLTQDQPNVLEIHCPPRTIETSFLGFRPLLRDERFPTEMVAQTSTGFYEQARGKKARSVTVFNPEPHSGAMIVEARAFARAFREAGCTNVLLVQESIDIGRSTTDILYLCDELHSEPAPITDGDQVVVPAPHTMEMISDRAAMGNMLRGAGIPTPDSVVLPRGSGLEVEQVRQDLGSWVVVKSRIHRPWWSELKQRTAFMCLALEEHVARLRRMIAQEDVMIEAMVTDSIDTEGHFGELRVFSVLSM